MNQKILNLGKSAAIYGVGTMVTRFIGLFLLPVFTAYLTPGDYGVMALLALLAMVAQPVFGLGLGAAMGPAYFEGNSPTRKSRTLWTTFMLSLASACLLMVLAWAIPGPLSSLVLKTPEHGFLVSLTLTGCAFGILSIPFALRIQFEQRAKVFVVTSLMSAVAGIVLNIVAVVYLGWGIKGMIAAQAIGQALHFLIFAAVGSRGTTFQVSASIRDELLRLGIPLVPGFAFIFILLQSNRYILQWLEKLDQVGIYSVGFNIGMVMTLLVGGFTQAWYPFFMSYFEKPDEAKEIFGSILRLYVLVFGGITICFFIFARPITLLFTQPDFHAAYKVIGFSALAQFFMGLFSLLTPGMYYTKEVKYVSLWQGVAAGISIPINIAFIKAWGMFGAGMALAVSCALPPLFQWLWNHHRREQYLQVDYQWRTLFKLSLGYLFIGALSLLLIPEKIVWAIAYSLILCAGLAALAYWQIQKMGSYSSALSMLVKAAWR